MRAFTFRLIAAEAAAVGGAMTFAEGTVRLDLPEAHDDGLTATNADPTHRDGGIAQANS